MKPTDEPVAGPKNNPMMPIIWVRHHTWESGKTSRVVCSTIGAAADLESEGLRRLFVNAVYWGLRMEDKLQPTSNVNCIGEFHPTFFGFGKFQRGLRPSDFESDSPIPPKSGVKPAGRQSNDPKTPRLNRPANP